MYSEDKSNLDQEKKDNCFEKKKRRSIKILSRKKRQKGKRPVKTLRNDIPAAINDRTKRIYISKYNASVKYVKYNQDQGLLLRAV